MDSNSTSGISPSADPSASASPKASPLEILRTAVDIYCTHLKGRRLWVYGITDYRDRATWRKVEAAFEVQFPGSKVNSVPTNEYNTLEAGVHVSHYALAPAHYRPPTSVTFTNVARITTDSTAKRTDKLILAVLENNMLVFSYLNGDELAYVCDQITAAFELESDDRHVDFRSRDILPKIVASILNGGTEFVKRAYHPDQLASLGIVPGDRWRIGWVDEPYHNIKTPIRIDDPALAKIPFGALVRLKIGDVQLPVRFQRSIAALDEGELGLVRSSDSEHDGSKKTPHMVIAVKGSHAWGVFLQPKIGTHIKLMGPPILPA